MQIATILSFLESLAPPVYQESYDNAGLLTGSSDWACTGILATLDCTEVVVEEAVAKNCNLVVAHHPIVFGGLKKLNGKNYVERTVISAIKKDIAIYAIHTNLDNVIDGVNGRMAAKLGLVNTRILAPKEGILMKLSCYVPPDHLDRVRDAVFAAGAGQIGAYSECSWSAEGMGTFKGGAGSTPFVGEPGRRHDEKETRFDVILPDHFSTRVVKAMLAAHPYEEVAYDLVKLANAHHGVGSGLIGDLPESMAEEVFLERVISAFGTPVVRHTRLTGKAIHRVALCGGAGSFLISKALSAGANFYITADVKYHEFFDANDRMVIADIGHFESEQFTVDLLFEVMREKFTNFAVLKSDAKTNPVHYYTGADGDGPARPVTK